MATRQEYDVSSQAAYQTLRELTTFLAKYSFIYNFKVTEFFRQRIWEKFPTEWMQLLTELSTDDLNSIPYGLLKDDWPSSFSLFLEEALRLSSLHLPRKVMVQPVKVVDSCQFGMSPKKLHEVSHLVAAIDALCCRSDCKFIVDIGSGLGYLDLVLSKQLGYEVLGLENQSGRASGAGKRANTASEKKDIYSGSGCFISKHFELMNSEDSILQLERIINETWPSDTGNCDICLIGLHCCGDLTPATLRAFTHLPRAQCIVCLGCCYHRMQPSGEGFSHFPLSTKLKTAMMETNVEGDEKWHLTKYGLRLAAQETRSRWRKQTNDDHENHIRNVAYRALFELHGELSFKKQRRKLVTKNGRSDFESYVDEIMKRTTLTDSVDVKGRLLQLYRDYELYFVYIEPVTMLQVILQPIVEALVVSDRVEFMREAGFHSNVLAMFDDCISPRNCAIVASRDSSTIDCLFPPHLTS